MNLKYNKITLKRKINNLETIWKKELNPFILTELPSFDIVKNFVLNNIK